MGITDIANSKPVIIVNRSDVQSNYLSLYLFNSGLPQQEIDFDINSQGSNKYKIQPSKALDPGIYCLIQGDPSQSSVDIPYWCFQILSGANPRAMESTSESNNPQTEISTPTPEPGNCPPNTKEKIENGDYSMLKPGVSLIGCDLEGLNLQELDLSNADLRNSDFYQADLSNSNLSNADLRGANFLFAAVNGTSLDNAILDGAIIDVEQFSKAKSNNYDSNKSILRISRGVFHNSKAVWVPGKQEVIIWGSEPSGATVYHVGPIDDQEL